MKSKNIMLIALLAILAYNTSCAQKNGKKGDNKVSETTKLSEMDSISYAFGVVLGNNLKQNNVADLDIETLKKGIEDALTDKMTMDAKQAGLVVNQHIQQASAAAAAKAGEENLKAGQEFLAKNKERKEVVTLPSGLQYEIIKEGNGAIPKETDEVTTHYHGTLVDGSVFDSSVERGQPATFPVNGVIPGWVEALQLMPTGSKWRLYIPSDLAYGERGPSPKIGPNATLIFDIELLSIK